VTAAGGIGPSSAGSRSDDGRNETREGRQHGDDTAVAATTTPPAAAGSYFSQEGYGNRNGNDKSALEEALRVAPNLVLRESDPVRFLRDRRRRRCAGKGDDGATGTDDGDDSEAAAVRDAARRLVGFWKKRKRIFGPSRFCLPLDQTGRGALEKDDVDAYRTGYLSILPNDAKGRQVIFFDTNRSGTNVEQNRRSRMRCLFYVLYLASQQRQQTQPGGTGSGVVDGVKPAVLVRYANSPKFDRTRFLQFVQLVDVFPLEVETMLCVYAPPPGALRAFTSTVVPMMTEVLDRHFPGRVRNVVGESAEAIRAELEEHEGLTRRSLPELLGGFWNEDNFSKWNARRLDIELRLEASGLSAATTTTTTTTTPSDEFNEDAEQRDGKIAATTTIHEEGTAASAVEQHHRQVSSTIGSNEGNDDDDVDGDGMKDRFSYLDEKLRQLKRKRDLEYSRNRRKQKKNDEGGLRAACAYESQRNLALRNENRRLTLMLAEAGAAVRRMEMARSTTTVAGLGGPAVADPVSASIAAYTPVLLSTTASTIPPLPTDAPSVAGVTAAAAIRRSMDAASLLQQRQQLLLRQQLQLQQESQGGLFGHVVLATSLFPGGGGYSGCTDSIASLMGGSSFPLTRTGVTTAPSAAAMGLSIEEMLALSASSRAAAQPLGPSDLRSLLAARDLSMAASPDRSYLLGLLQQQHLGDVPGQQHRQQQLLDLLLLQGGVPALQSFSGQDTERREK